MYNKRAALCFDSTYHAQNRKKISLSRLHYIHRVPFLGVQGVFCLLIRFLMMGHDPAAQNARRSGHSWVSQFSEDFLRWCFESYIGSAAR